MEVKTLRDVKVLDILPYMVSSTNEFGTLKPTTIKREEKHSHGLGVGDLQTKEERVLSYKVKSKMNLLGEVSCLRQSCSLSTKRGIVQELKSLKLRVIKKKSKSKCS